MEQQLELPKKEKKTRFQFTGKHAVIIGAVLLVAVALTLNFVLFGQDRSPVTDQPTGENTEDGGNVSVDQTAGYFSAAQVSRQRARDEAKHANKEFIS